MSFPIERQPAALTHLQRVPTLDELAANPELACRLPIEVARAMLCRCVCLLNALHIAALPASQPVESKEDRLIDIDEAAQRSAMSRHWFYRNGKRLPFARKVGRSLRFSEQGLSRWIASRRA